MTFRDAQGTSLQEVGWGYWSHLKKWKKKKNDNFSSLCLMQSRECHWRPWGEAGGDEDLRPGAGG